MALYTIKINTEEKGDLFPNVFANTEQEAIYKAVDKIGGLTIHKIVVWDIQ